MVALQRLDETYRDVLLIALAFFPPSYYVALPLSSTTEHFQSSVVVLTWCLNLVLPVPPALLFQATETFQNNRRRPSIILLA